MSFACDSECNQLEKKLWAQCSGKCDSVDSKVQIKKVKGFACSPNGTSIKHGAVVDGQLQDSSVTMLLMIGILL